MSQARFQGIRGIRAGLVAGLVGLLTAAPVGAQSPRGPDDLLEQARRTNQVAAQKAEADVRQALRDAQRLAASDAARAVERLKTALASLENDTALSEARRAALVRMLKDRIRVTEETGDAAAAAAAALNEKQAQDAIRRAGQERQAQDAEKTRQQVAEVNELRKSGRTEEARQKAEELAKQQPRNPAAQASSRSATAHEQIKETRDLRTEGERRRVVTMREVERSAMPANGEIEFPKDWKERIKYRKTTTPLTAKEQAILRALSMTVTVRFRDTRFEDVIEYLQTLTGQTILTDKAALDEVQVTYDTPVTANVKGVTVRTLLRKILSELNLTYVVKDETIQVTSLARARELMVTRSYYVADIIAGVGWQHPVQIVQNINTLIDMIQSSVDPPSWRVNGGGGTIVYNPGTLSLIIRQSAEVHAQLASSGLLK
jgi:hypothetical protein